MDNLNLFNLDGDKNNVYTPSRLNAEIQIILENNYPNIWINGEISNYKKYSSGHAYFQLKDAGAQVNAVMFNAAALVRFEVKDGLQVKILGRVSAYAKRGDYQIIVNRMEPSGTGDLFKKFELLKAKLSAEGIFDAENKKVLPGVINRACIVTSGDGAALHDILAVFKKYKINFETIIYPVKVQGGEAKFEIAGAIEYLNAKYPDTDIMLVGRGGGSAEDLWAFNEEITARAVYNSEIPVISCVGHETDYTIADMAADFRAATPTYAAETVAQINAGLRDKLENLHGVLKYEISRKIDILSERLNVYAKSRALTQPHLIYEDSIRYVDGLAKRVSNVFASLYKLKKSELESVCAALNMVSPLNVLKRGYSVSKNLRGEIIKSARGLKAGDALNITFSDGSVNAEVK